jgi:uncharacterized protein (DUF2236 family)
MASERPAGVLSEPGQPKNDGYFGPDSITWKVQASPAMVVGASAAALSQMLLPRLAYMIDQRSISFREPETRNRFTAEWGMTTVFGDTDQADRANQLLRNIHHAKVATDPTTSEQFHADQQDLLVWVLNTMTFFNLRAVGRWGPELAPAEKDRYVAEQKILGRLLGINDVDALPGNVAELKAQMHGMTPKLVFTTEAGRVRDAIVGAPVVPTIPRAVTKLMSDAAISLLTPQMRTLYGYRWSRLRFGLVNLEARLLIRLVMWKVPYAKLVPDIRAYVMTHAFGGKVRSAKPATREQIATATTAPDDSAPLAAG